MKKGLWIGLIVLIAIGGIFYFSMLSKEKASTVLQEPAVETVQKKILDEDNVYVYFYAPTCQYCIELKPNLEKVLRDKDMSIDTINVQENQHIPSMYGVTGWPTIIYFENGTEKDRFVGNQPIENIEEFFTR